MWTALPTSSGNECENISGKYMIFATTTQFHTQTHQLYNVVHSQKANHLHQASALWYHHPHNSFVLRWHTSHDMTKLNTYLYCNLNRLFEFWSRKNDVPDLVGRPVLEHCTTQYIFLRERSPYMRVIAVIAIVSHHENATWRNQHRGHLVEWRLLGHIPVKFVSVNICLTSLNLNNITFAAHLNAPEALRSIGWIFNTTLKMKFCNIRMPRVVGASI